ncbi:BMP family lipoprotein [Roseinatronobacter monicus]|uniref:Nucleoside-binding protein n=1 Tax=Roseinatronobacter monicus TaxID=393481 RepID=A0A543KCD5_9RHOB|nr:BMP family ABC transporter substrate-binding protein [Roseinatronobacter monicus]TQM92748.1 nucleoside-binding protein [Roseinatronobacter monicus]
MIRISTFTGAASVLALTAGMAQADPALMFDLGGKFDKSFNEAAYNGAERWRAETGGTYREIEMQAAAQRVQFARRLAEAGSNPVVVMGFQNAPTLEEVAPDYPDTSFVLIDAVVDLPNVRSVIFAEHEGSYLVGMLAAMANETGTISFVGGMEIPLIASFACGYAQGAKAVNPDINVIVNYTGDTPAAWNDPVRGGEIARAQISQNSDVVFAAAGGTGLGVLQAAEDAGVFSIGVDSNQNHLHPGSVLTSMLKLVDQAVYDAFTDGPGLEAGVVQMDLAAGGVGYAMDEHNADLISDQMQEMVEAAKAAISTGELVVHDYRVDSVCPAF